MARAKAGPWTRGLARNSGSTPCSMAMIGPPAYFGTLWIALWGSVHGLDRIISRTYMGIKSDLLECGATLLMARPAQRIGFVELRNRYRRGLAGG